MWVHVWAYSGQVKNGILADLKMAVVPGVYRFMLGLLASSGEMYLTTDRISTLAL